MYYSVTQMTVKFPTKKQINSYLNKASRDVVLKSIAEAQEFMFDAWECSNYVDAVQLIKKALKTSPLCADAYTYYSSISGDSSAIRQVYLETAVYAGELALDEPLLNFKGHCWGYIETRPYMRARACLAECLWELGHYDESILHYREMLELNPNDNQGLRYLLSSHYLELERIDELEVLFSMYPDEYSPFFLYTKALLAFRKEQPSAKKIALEAIKCNHHVSVYLNKKIKQPENTTGYVTAGGEDQALEYVNSNLLAWMRTPGAIEWLVKIQNISDK